MKPFWWSDAIREAGKVKRKAEEQEEQKRLAERRAVLRTEQESACNELLSVFERVNKWHPNWEVLHFSETNEVYGGQALPTKLYYRISCTGPSGFKVFISSASSPDSDYEHVAKVIVYQGDLKGSNCTYIYNQSFNDYKEFSNESQFNPKARKYIDDFVSRIAAPYAEEQKRKEEERVRTQQSIKDKFWND